MSAVLTASTDMGMGEGTQEAIGQTRGLYSEPATPARPRLARGSERLPMRAAAARERRGFWYCGLTMASPLPDPVPLHLVRRALVTKLRHHGDVLLASPVFTALARAAPGIEIDALVYLETAPMLAGHPAIAQLHTIDRGWKKRGVARAGARRMGAAARAARAPSTTC